MKVEGVEMSEEQAIIELNNKMNVVSEYDDSGYWLKLLCQLLIDIEKYGYTYTQILNYYIGRIDLTDTYKCTSLELLDDLVLYNEQCELMGE